MIIKNDRVKSFVAMVKDSFKRIYTRSHATDDYVGMAFMDMYHQSKW